MTTDVQQDSGAEGPAPRRLKSGKESLKLAERMK